MRQAYFPTQTPNPWEKIGKALKGSVDPEQFAALQRTTSAMCRDAREDAVADKSSGAKPPTQRQSGCSPTIEYGAIAVALVWLIYRHLMIAPLWSSYEAWIASWSMVTLLLYGLDKRHAEAQFGLRVPEDVLHLLAVVGGAIGALLGMILFRHKIRKPQFLIVALISFMAQMEIGMRLVSFR